MNPTKLFLRRGLLLLAFVGTLGSSFAATNGDIPILKSGSKNLTIVDGDHVKKDYWVIMPERNPDIYYVEIPMKPHSVTFRSDIDAITFSMKYGEEHDFLVLLDGKVPCHTRICARQRKLQPFSVVNPTGGLADTTIPFRVGDNDKIYIKGRLNGGEELDFQFDLGAGGCVIKQGSEAKANMRFNGTTTLWNSNGRNEVPFSSSNRLEIGSMVWDSLPFVVAHNMTHREDGLVGNTLFQDKVVEIDYSRRVLVVHEVLPELEDGYSKHPAMLDGPIPYIHGSFTIGNEHREGWFMFDTGAYTSILVSRTASPANKLWGEVRKMVWNKSAADRQLTIGKHVFTDFNYTIRKGRGDDDSLGLLGNDVLKRFNVILDNQNGFFYLRPNSFFGTPFTNREQLLAKGLVAGGALLVLIVGGGGVLYRRRSKLKKSTV